MPDLRAIAIRAIPAFYSLGLAAVVFGPLFGPGYLLYRDAVSTPRSYLTDSALGLGDAAPRAVPQDAIVAVASTVLDGGLVVKAILFASLWLAGWGAAVLAKSLLDASTGPQIVAATIAIWNPFVAERLLQGHWSLLAGYAALPWVVHAALKGSWPGLAVCFAVAGLTPTGAVLAVLTAVAVVRGRHLIGVVVLAVAASAPWLIAAALSEGGGSSDPAGVAAFAARAEPWLGTTGSLAGLGGIWNANAVPTSRTSIYALVGTVLLLVVVAAGLPGLLRRRDRVIYALALLAVGAVAFGALAATSWGTDAGEWVVVHVPGSGLLRDTQKWVALAMPLYALSGASAACESFASLWAPKRLTSVIAAGLALIATPDLVWGVSGALKPVHYPSSWDRVVAEVGHGDVAVLPGGMFRSFPYTGRALVLDPAPRMLRSDVLQTGELIVAGGVVKGEGDRAARVEKTLLDGGPPSDLSELGVAWVLVEHTTPGPLGSAEKTLAQLERSYDDAELTLYKVPGDVAVAAKPRALAIAAHALWAMLLAGGLLGLAVRRRRATADQA